MFLAFDGANVAAMERITKDIDGTYKDGQCWQQSTLYLFTSHDYKHWPLHIDEFQSLWVIYQHFLPIYISKYKLQRISFINQFSK